jgi:hypothetical protein
VGCDPGLVSRDLLFTSRDLTFAGCDSLLETRETCAEYGFCCADTGENSIEYADLFLHRRAYRIVDRDSSFVNRDL